MTFTNVTGVAFYLQCCHRSVEPGGSFQVPWESARRDRGLRSAMNCGRLAWREDRGEAPVKGSPPIPDFAGIAARRKAEEDEKAAATGERVRAAMAEHSRGVSENMARMGNFDVPVPVKREVRAAAVSVERPVTDADIIADGSVPRSLEDIRRHNRASRPAK